MIFPDDEPIMIFVGLTLTIAAVLFLIAVIISERDNP